MENEKISSPDSISLEVPGTFSRGNVTFTTDFVKYDDITIFYKDITAVAFHSTKNSINFIPTSQSYKFYIGSLKKEFTISFSAILYVGNQEKKSTWTQLIELYQQLIEPALIQKLLQQIFEEGKIIEIGSLRIDKNGFSREKLFGGRETILWNGRLYLPQFDAGYVNLYKDDNGKGKPFLRISMEELNAVVLPELIRACKTVYESDKPV